MELRTMDLKRQFRIMWSFQKKMGFFAGCVTTISVILLVDQIMSYFTATSMPPPDCGITSEGNGHKEALFTQVKVLCLVATYYRTHRSRADYVASTWGKRCNKLYFLSERDDPILSILKTDVTSGREHLTAKTMLGLKIVARHHLEDFDWFLKADDDSYVVMQNLRLLLSDHSPDEAVYFGQHFHEPELDKDYFSGGAGYVLSRKALALFQEGMQYNREACPVDGGDEDVNIGICMKALGVRLGDSSDSEGRSRFHVYPPNVPIRGYPYWVQEYSINPLKKGIGAVSTHPVTFHYVQPDVMCMLEYLLYHVGVHGFERSNSSQDSGEKNPKAEQQQDE